MTSAAAASVATATATSVWNPSTCVASSTSPAYTPTSSPVTIVYASVLETILSISYSRYRSTATPIETGTATMPNEMTLAIARTAAEALPGTARPNTRPSHGDQNTAGQPLELLAALTRGPPPGHELAGHAPQR